MKKEIPGAEIAFVTSKGTQAWQVGEARFSISEVREGYCMNLYLVSNDSMITKQLDSEMDSSYGPNIECSVWLAHVPQELVGFEFVIPNYDYHNPEDYGYNYNASNNMYFYEHHTMENIIVKVERKLSDDIYELSWTSDCEDIFDWQGPMMKINATVQVALSDSLKGYWLK